MLRRDLVSLQSCQSLHCSRTYTKWVCLWFLLSVNAQTSLSMRAASPEPSLLSHMRKMGIHTAYSFSQCSDEPKRVCSLARASTALAHAQNGRKYGIFLSVNAKTRLSMHAVKPERSLLSHMRKMGVHTTYSFSKCLDEP